MAGEITIFQLFVIALATFTKVTWTERVSISETMSQDTYFHLIKDTKLMGLHIGKKKLPSPPWGWQILRLLNEIIELNPPTTGSLKQYNDDLYFCVSYITEEYICFGERRTVRGIDRTFVLRDALTRPHLRKSHQPHMKTEPNLCFFDAMFRDVSIIHCVIIGRFSRFCEESCK